MNCEKNAHKPSFDSVFQLKKVRMPNKRGKTVKINWRKIVCCLKNVNVAYLQNVWEENTCYKMVKLGGETKLTCAAGEDSLRISKEGSSMRRERVRYKI